MHISNALLVTAVNAKVNSEAIPWIFRCKLYPHDGDNHYEKAKRIQYEVILWSASTINRRFRPRPHESRYFWNRIFLHESDIRPQETIKSAIRKDILLKPPLKLETGLRPPPHESE